MWDEKRFVGPSRVKFELGRGGVYDGLRPMCAPSRSLVTYGKMKGRASGTRYLVQLSTSVGSKYSDRPWVKIQSARWVNFKSARTKSRFSEEQIIGFIKEAEAGMPVASLCRKHGFSDAILPPVWCCSGACGVLLVKQIESMRSASFGARSRQEHGKISRNSRNDWL